MQNHMCWPQIGVIIKTIYINQSYGLELFMECKTFQSNTSHTSKDGDTKKSELTTMTGLMSEAAAATATASSYKDPKKPKVWSLKQYRVW